MSTSNARVRPVSPDALPIPPRFQGRSLDEILPSVRALLARLSCAAWWRELFEFREELAAVLQAESEATELGEAGIVARFAVNGRGRALNNRMAEHAAVEWFARTHCPFALPHVVPSEKEVERVGADRVADRCANTMRTVEGCVRVAFPASKPNAIAISEGPSVASHSTAVPQQKAQPPGPKDPLKLTKLLASAQKLQVKGKELDAVQKVCDGGGSVSRADLALKLNWEPLYDDKWGSLRSRLNLKFRPQGWHFYRLKNKVCVKVVAPQATARK
jgi:hypothetical protein